MEPLRAAELYVSETVESGGAWLNTPVEDVASTLRWLGLSELDVEDVADRFASIVRDEVFGPLIGGMTERLVRDRGRIDEPIPIWPDFDEWGDAGRLWWIYVVALATPSLVEHYHAAGLPDDIIHRTLSTLKRHVGIHFRKWGTLGVDAGWWMIPIVRAELLEVGSLQFHRLHLGVSTLAPHPWFEDRETHALGPGFRQGDEALGVHIPDGADLSTSALDETFARARHLLATVWPARTRRLATLQSWMMDPRLGTHLGPQSRIVGLQRRFHVTDRWGEDVDNVVEFVFRQPVSHLPGLVGRTSVQRLVLETLRSEGTWRDAVGWLDFDGPSVH